MGAEERPGDMARELGFSTTAVHNSNRTAAEGEPHRFGVIELHSDEHRDNARGTIQRDGSFTLEMYGESDGAPQGTHRVVVQFFAADAVQCVQHDHFRLVDTRYADYGATNLELTVATQRNDVELTVHQRAKTNR